MNLNMAKPETFDHTHLVYYFTIPLKQGGRNWKILVRKRRHTETKTKT